MAGNETVGLSWFETLKAKLNPSALMQQFRESKSTILEMILYFGIGFFTSFLLKRYGQYIIVFIIMLIVLQQSGIIQVTVDWNTIQHFMGLQKTVVEGNIVTLFWEWVKLNLVPVLSFCVGFILGLKVG